MANNNTVLKSQRLFGFHTSTPNLGETALSDLSHSVSLPLFFLVLLLLEILQKWRIYSSAIQRRRRSEFSPAFPTLTSLVFLYNSLSLRQIVVLKDFHPSDKVECYICPISLEAMSFVFFNKHRDLKCVLYTTAQMFGVIESLNT